MQNGQLFIALMRERPAGAGKSTLLDILAMRKTGGQLSGMITVNGRRMARARFRSISTYVPQVTPVSFPVCTGAQLALYTPAAACADEFVADVTVSLI